MCPLHTTAAPASLLLPAPGIIPALPWFSSCPVVPITDLCVGWVELSGLFPISHVSGRH